MNKPTIDGLKTLAKLIKITDQKTGNLQDWTLYNHQIDLLNNLLNHDRSIILKARQLGISTVTIFYTLTLGIMNPNTNIGIVADKYENSIGLLGKIRDMVKQLGVQVVGDNQKKLTLSNGSNFTAITINTGVGSESTSGRSKTFHVLLMSESAFYNNSFAVFASLTSAAIPDAIIILESTATAAKNAFRSIWDNSTYYKHFISMQDHTNYVDDPNNISDEQYNDLQSRFGFSSRPHAAFWQKKLQNEFGGNINHLLREFPIIEAHSWTAASGRFIDVDPPIKQPIKLLGKSKVFIDVGHGGHYIVGVDPAAGVGRDYTSIVVYDLKAKNIAAIYSSNTDKFDQVVAEMRIINSAYKPHAFYIETNGIGTGLIPLAQQYAIPVIEHKSTEASKYSGLLKVKVGIETAQLCADDKFSSDASSLIYEMMGEKEKFNHPGDSLMAMSFCLIYEDNYKYVVNAPPPRPNVPQGHFDMERSLRIGRLQQKRNQGY